MSDADMREELAALELLLSRDALWAPIPAEYAAINNMIYPRPQFEKRRDELRAALSETKLTMLTGFRLGSTGRLESPDGFVDLDALLPEKGDVIGERFDFEITVTRRPHFAPAKTTEEP